MPRITRLVALFAVLAAFIVPGIAAAHEEREVGDYKFVVGFAEEPAYENEANGIWVSVANSTTGAPVEGLEETLRAQVIYGASTRDMELSPAWGEAGVYTSNFYPTAAGDYTFRFFGEIDGTPVDESFTSSPEGFHAVNSVSELQFPSQISTNAELQNQIRTAQLLGAGGLAVGVAGLALAVWALRSRHAAPVAATGALRGAWKPESCANTCLS